MYKLYTNQSIISTILQSNKIKHQVLKMDSFFLENSIHIILNVSKIIDPNEWLIKPFTCISVYKLKTNGDESCLEMFIQSPIRNGFYYAIGEENIVMLSTVNANDSFELYKDTVQMLIQESIYCHLPFIRLVHPIR